MGAIYYKICIDSYEIYLLECFTSPLNRLSTLIVFLMIVSSLGFFYASKAFDRVNHSILFGKLSNKGIPQYVIRIFYLTGMKTSRCVYAGEGLILLFSVLLMGFVKAAFCRITCLIYMSTTSVWLLMLAE